MQKQQQQQQPLVSTGLTANPTANAAEILPPNNAIFSANPPCNTVMTSCAGCVQQQCYQPQCQVSGWFICDSRCNLTCDSSCELWLKLWFKLWLNLYLVISFYWFFFVFLETMEMTAALLHSQPPLQLVSCHGPIMHPATPSNQRLANDTYRWQLIFLSVPVTNPLPIIKHYCSNPFLFLCFELHSMALTIGRTRSTKIYILWYLVICRLRNPMHKYINM